MIVGRPYLELAYKSANPRAPHHLLPVWSMPSIMWTVRDVPHHLSLARSMPSRVDREKRVGNYYGLCKLRSWTAQNMRSWIVRVHHNCCMPHVSHVSGLGPHTCVHLGQPRAGLWLASMRAWILDLVLLWLGLVLSFFRAESRHFSQHAYSCMYNHAVLCLLYIIVFMNYKSFLLHLPSTLA